MVQLAFKVLQEMMVKRGHGVQEEKLVPLDKTGKKV